MIQKENLIEGQYYVNEYTNIFLQGKSDSVYYLGNRCTDFSIGGGFFNNALRLATPEEIHWLETCVYLKQYVSFETAMLNFNEINRPYKNESKDLEPIYKKLLNYEI